jgi:hypothetical protein
MKLETTRFFGWRQKKAGDVTKDAAGLPLSPQEMVGANPTSYFRRIIFLVCV